MSTEALQSVADKKDHAVEGAEVFEPSLDGIEHVASEPPTLLVGVRPQFGDLYEIRRQKIGHTIYEISDGYSHRSAHMNRQRQRRYRDNF